MTQCIKGDRKGVLEQVAGPENVANLTHWSPTFAVFRQAQSAPATDERVK